MNDQKTQEKWTDAQLKYAQFLARGRTTRDGQKRTKEQFADALGVNAATLWRWEQQDGWASLLYEESLKHLAKHLPSLNNAMIGKAAGQKEFKNADPKAYQILVRQYEVLKSDKTDITTDGKALPTPVLPISDIRQ